MHALCVHVLRVWYTGVLPACAVVTLMSWSSFIYFAEVSYAHNSSLIEPATEVKANRFCLILTLGRMGNWAGLSVWDARKTLKYIKQLMLSFFLFFPYFIGVCLHMLHVLMVWESRRAYENCVSSTTIWVTESELRSSGLSASSHYLLSPLTGPS